MAHYSIFVPGEQGADSQYLLGLCGMQDLNRHGGWEWQYVDSNNPAGTRGVIGTVRKMNQDDPIRGVDTDRQKWVKGPAVEGVCESGSCWFITEPSRPPRPIELKHNEQFAGNKITLKDGNEYLIPEAIKLPQTVGRDPETGRVVHSYSGDYEQFCLRSEKFIGLFFTVQVQIEAARHEYGKMVDEDKIENFEKEFEIEFTLEDTWLHAAEALSLNYRISDPIMGHGYLDLVEDRQLVAIVRHTIGYPDILTVKRQKKTVDHVSIPVG